MQISNIQNMPIWAELFVLLIGIIFLFISYQAYKSKVAHGPWFLLGYGFAKDRHPIAFWIFLSLWFGIGLSLVIFAIYLMFFF